MTTKTDALERAKRLGLRRADSDTLGIAIEPKAEDAAAETLAKAESLTAAINRYAATFAHVTDGECPGCGTRLTGLLGSFTWGFVHGEGYCRSCGYPCRAYHRPKDDDGKEIFVRAFQAILPYHPDDLEVRHDDES